MNKQNVKRLYEKPTMICVYVESHGLLEGLSMGISDESIEGGGDAKGIELGSETDSDFNNRWSSSWED